MTFATLPGDGKKPCVFEVVVMQGGMRLRSRSSVMSTACALEQIDELRRLYPHARFSVLDASQLELEDEGGLPQAA